MAQTAKNTTLLGRLNYTQDLSDVWGYAAGDGSEYALVGVFDGFSIVNVSNPASPVESFFVPGPSTIWRDVKVWDGYAYVTNENASGGGLLVVNLNYLPDSIQYWNWTGSGNVTFESAHNIFIDEQGYGYIVGADYGRGGAIIVDLFTTPGQPILKTVYDDKYIHDIFVRGDTMWTAEINNGWFRVIDISDKSQPTVPVSKVLAQQVTPFNFTHNLWLSDDGQFLYTTDERSNAPVAGYNVSDLSNIEFTDEFLSNAGSGVIPHNTFVVGDFLATAHYRDGLTVVDASDPYNIIQTGWYDSSPLAGNGFNGAWGVYPYLPSGNILITDIEEGLFVVQPQYTYAARVEGTISDSLTTAPIPAATVEIVSKTGTSTNTNLLGRYKTGIADSGTYDIQVSSPGYFSKTITGIPLSNGITTTLDVELVPVPTYPLTGQVVGLYSGAGLPLAQVAVPTGDTTFHTVTDANGFFTLPGVYTGSYTLLAGHWGHVTRQVPVLVDANTDTLLVKLKPGVYDDFVFDMGWRVTGTATTGQWERGKPNGTRLNQFVEVQTDADVADDFGDQAYVTGNNGVTSSDDDIDNGSTFMTSPLFDGTLLKDPAITGYYWFTCILGQGTPNDSLHCVIDNGTRQARVLMAWPGMSTAATWTPFSIRISDHVTPTATMRVTFEAWDRSPGHVVEAAIDKFAVVPADGRPEAAFDRYPAEGCAPLLITLEDYSSGDVNAVEWVLPGSDLLTATGPTVQASYATPGSYGISLVAIGANGNDTLTITDAVEVFDGPSLTLDANDDNGSGTGSAWVSATGTPPFTYLWNDPAGQTTDTATSLQAGLYTVTVTDANGCLSTDSVEVQLINLVEAPSMGIALYPNPHSNQLSIQVSGDLPVFVQLIDMQGRIIFTDRVSGAGVHALPAQWPAGMYQLIVQQGEHRQVIPVVRL